MIKALIVSEFIDNNGVLHSSLGGKDIYGMFITHNWMRYFPVGN